MSLTPDLSSQPRLLIVGGGWAGFELARSLQSKVKGLGGVVTVVDPLPYMTYQPFLPEVVGGHIEGRHAVVDLKTHLKDAEVLRGTVVKVEHERKVATVRGEDGSEFEIPYQDIAVTAGATTRVFPIPGLGEQGIGLKTVEEAVALRNQILERLDAASLMTNGEERRRALTFVVVGGGFAGVETVAEMENLIRTAVERNENLSQTEIRIVLVEAMGRIMPEVSADQAEGVVQHLRDRGIEVLLNTSLGDATDGVMSLIDMGDKSEKEKFGADTLVWTAGVAANGVAKETGFPVEQRGRIEVTPTLQVKDGADGVLEGAWACGDIAAVPDLTGAGPGGFCVPNAQHAGRQAKRLAANYLAVRHGEGEVEEYVHKSLGAVAGLGFLKGVGNPMGVKLAGVPAWLAHRGYHVYAMPTLERRFRIAAGWIAETLFGRDSTSVNGQDTPFNAFRSAAGAELEPSRFEKRASASALDEKVAEPAI